MRNLVRVSVALGLLLEAACLQLPGEAGVGPDSGSIEQADTVAPRCDGVTDDTAAIQAQIDAGRFKLGLGRPVVLPAGVCVVSQTLIERGVAGESITGQGADATVLEWHGDGVSPLLRLDRTLRAHLERFSVQPGAGYTLAVGVQLENGDGCKVDPNLNHTCKQWSSSQAVLQDLAFVGAGRLGDAVYVHLFDPAADAKNDLHGFYRVQANGYTGSAFHVEGVNPKGLLFQNCLCQASTLDSTNTRTGQSCVRSDAGSSFTWRDGSTLGHLVADFDIIAEGNDTVSISGVFAEKEWRFLRVRPGALNRPMTVTLEGIRYGGGGGESDPNGEVVQFFNGGPLEIRDGRWSGPNAWAPRFRYDPPSGDPRGFLFVGNYVTGPAVSDRFPAVQPDFSAGNILP